MDHKWGRWVTHYGLSGAGATLASSYAVQFGHYVLTNWTYQADYAWAWYVPPDTAPDAPTYPFLLVKHAPHFPYGYRVDPDGPV